MEHSLDSSGRYSGKPLLRLLECYVLWSLNELSEKDEESLRLMVPKLQEAYGKSGSWIEIISSVMDFPGNMPEFVREMWVRNQVIAEENKTTLSAEQFARIFVDQNFSN